MIKKATIFTLLLIAPIALPQNSKANVKEAVLREFQAAFNAHDAAAMAALVAENIRWLSVDDGTIALELEGRPALVEAMREYFTSCPTCRSEITDLMPTGDRVSVVEVASWAGRDGPRSQRSIAIYEFSGSLIKAVYYFPAEPMLEPQEALTQ